MVRPIAIIQLLFLFYFVASSIVARSETSVEVRTTPDDVKIITGGGDFSMLPVPFSGAYDYMIIADDLQNEGENREALGIYKTIRSMERYRGDVPEYIRLLAARANERIQRMSLEKERYIINDNLSEPIIYFHEEDGVTCVSSELYGFQLYLPGAYRYIRRQNGENNSAVIHLSHRFLLVTISMELMESDPEKQDAPRYSDWYSRKRGAFGQLQARGQYKKIISTELMDLCPDGDLQTGNYKRCAIYEIDYNFGHERKSHSVIQYVRRSDSVGLIMEVDISNFDPEKGKGLARKIFAGLNIVR